MLFTYSLERSHDGVMWWGTFPTGNVSTTSRVAGSMTLTVRAPLFGT